MKYCKNRDEPTLIYYFWHQGLIAERIEKENIMSKLCEKYPGINYFNIVRDNLKYLGNFVKCSSNDLDMKSQINTTILKKYNLYLSWDPVLILIPGPLWNYMMANPNADLSVETINKIQVYNAMIIPNGIQIITKYDKYQPDNIILWFEDCINDEEFMKAQNMKTIL
jgi:hypothetical protein